MTDKKPLKKLSKGLLDLKFMKKTKERTIIEEDEEERQFLYQDQLAALNSTTKVVLLPSHYDMLTLMPCRLSFGGIEKDIEKLNGAKLTGIYQPAKEEPVEEQEEEADVSNAEMAAHFSSLNETLAKRFKNRPIYKSEFKKNNKRKSDEHFQKENHKKRKNEFMKPED